jgi:hypothetical protein
MRSERHVVCVAVRNRDHDLRYYTRLMDHFTVPVMLHFVKWCSSLFSILFISLRFVAHMICPSILFPSQPKISRPVDVQHTTHVSYNPITREYRGLPTQWKVELNRQFGHDPRAVESEKLLEYKSAIPTVLLKMKKFLLENNGLHTEGIFRLAPGPSVCDEAKEVLDSGNIIGIDVDVVVVANLIKIYYRELPTRIIPFDFREKISRCQSIIDCNDVVDSLSEPFRSLLMWLIDLAALFALFQSDNK